MNKLLSFVVILSACLATIAQAATVSGSLAINSILPDLSLLRPSTRVILDGGRYTTLVKAKGQFEFNNIAPGSYLLEVQSIDFIFPKLRLDVDGEKGVVRAAYSIYGQSWDATGYTVEQPLELRAKANANYFMKRQGFNLLGMFKNPMFLMIGFSAVMLLVMPKMMANMDPEALKEIQQSQADAQKMLSDIPSLSNMFGGGAAGGQPSSNNKPQQQR